MKEKILLLLMACSVIAIGLLSVGDATTVRSRVYKDQAVTSAGGGGGTSYTRAVVEKGWQITSYRTGDDGDLQEGLGWDDTGPPPRFTDNGDGTVTDTLTNLMWQKAADAYANHNWNDCIDYCVGLTLGSQTDWRLPNIKEFTSILDYEHSTPALAWNVVFTGYTNGMFWTGNTYKIDTAKAWYLNVNTGNFVNTTAKTDANQEAW